MTGHPPSYYAATAKGLRSRPPLPGDLRTDVCIIGGGLTGVSAALHLAERGIGVVLLEARRLGWGASGRNGGQLHSGQRLDQESLEGLIGEPAARALFELARDALTLVRTRIARHAIPCDLADGMLIAAAKPAHFRDLVTQAHYLARHYDCHRLAVVEPGQMAQYVASPRYHGGVRDLEGGHLHPLTFLLGLAGAAESAGARLFETTPVVALCKTTPTRVTTPHGTVTADAVILAGNAYLEHLVPEAAATILPINSFVGVTDPLSPAQAPALLPHAGAVADTRMVLAYYRLTADNRLLLGGGESYGADFPKDITRIIRERIAWVFPQMRDTPVSHAWGGRIAVTLSRMPEIRRLGSGRYLAHGFSGQGLAIAPLAGKLLAEAIAGEDAGLRAFEAVKARPLPGGSYLRRPLMVLAMLWATLKDRLL